MSRRTKQPAGGSRRSRRAELPQPPPAAHAESPKIVSNPIFRCEEEAGPSQQPKSSPGGGNQLRCVYRPNSLYALVHDPAAATGGNGTGKPLPLPPCRAHRAGQGASGTHVPASRSGPAALVAGGPHGRVTRRAATQDPFLAAYVACSKSGSGGGEDAAAPDRPQQKQRKGKKKKRNVAANRKGKEGEELAAVRGCGAIWSSGWAAAGAKYAGAMSCRHGCAVVEQKQGDAAPVAAAKEAGEEGPPAAVPTLDLSWAPTVLSARAMERRRQQR